MKKIVVLLGVLTLLLTPTAAATPPETCNEQNVNDHRSTDQADFLTGSEGQDVAALGESGDQYFAAGEDDTVCGNEGPDLLVGENGSDYLNGGLGDDRIVGLGGSDVLVASTGIDVLEGGAGQDTLRSGIVDDERDELYDGSGSDTIIGNNEDVWYRCTDGNSDDHSGFSGNILTDLSCPSV